MLEALYSEISHILSRTLVSHAGDRKGVSATTPRILISLQLEKTELLAHTHYHIQWV